MKNILRSASDALLSHFAASRVLLAIEFDGVLGPLDSSNSDAPTSFMRAGTAASLQEVCELFPCAVVSGRSRSDLAQILDGLGVAHLVGYHGSEFLNELELRAGWAARALPALQRALADCEGVDVAGENGSIAIAYRRARSKARALRAITKAISEIHERPQIVDGQDEVHLTPIHASRKSSVLAALAHIEGADKVIYVGSGEASEDVFADASPTRLLGIRVGRNNNSAARHYLRDQESIDSLLDALIRARRQRFAER